MILKSIGSWRLSWANALFLVGNCGPNVKAFAWLMFALLIKGVAIAFPVHEVSLIRIPANLSDAVHDSLAYKKFSR